jgi:integrator complex subunit 11
VVPLGAGQEVGRSCILVCVGGVTIMLDCGIHVGLRGPERFPDFRAASPSGDINGSVAAVLITHFHLDHCGALPVLTERCKYHGPIIMTYPTRALCPIMLEDCR